jgi:hypothetical protein
MDGWMDGWIMVRLCMYVLLVDASHLGLGLVQCCCNSFFFITIVNSQ